MGLTHGVKTGQSSSIALIHKKWIKNRLLLKILFSSERGLAAPLLIDSNVNTAYLHFDRLTTVARVTLPYNMLSHAVRFVTIVTPFGQKFSALSKPFDNFTWISLFVIIVSGALYLQTKCAQNVNEFHLFAILVEQDQSTAIRSQVANMVLMLYSIFAFLVSTAYREYLFTIMTTVNNPETPQNLQELVQNSQNFKIFTLTKAIHYKIGIDWKSESMVKLKIGEILNESYAGHLNLENLELYEKLQDSVSYFPESYYELGKYTTFSSAILIDFEWDLERFSEQSKIMSNNFATWGPKLSFFTARMQWVFERNAILRLTKPFLQGLDEFGVIARWRYYFEILRAVPELKLARSEFGPKKGFKIGKNCNILGFLFNKPYSMNFVSPATPIGFSFFGIVGFLWFGCYLVSIFSLGTELLWFFRHLLANKGKQYWVSFKNFCVGLFSMRTFYRFSFKKTVFRPLL